MGCRSGTACGVADFVSRTMEPVVLLPQGLRSGKWAWSEFPTIFFSSSGYVELLTTATEVSQMPATVMKDNYEKLNSS